jgi:hypothetical protein
MCGHDNNEGESATEIADRSFGRWNVEGRGWVDKTSGNANLNSELFGMQNRIFDTSTRQQLVAISYATGGGAFMSIEQKQPENLKTFSIGNPISKTSFAPSVSCAPLASDGFPPHSTR